MAVAGGLLAGAHVARDSGARGDFRAGGARIIRGADDPILPPCWATGISCVDDARVIDRICNRPGALPCIDSSAVEFL